jgi:cyanophycinase
MTAAAQNDDMERRSDVHLIGGGWDPGALSALYGPFLADAGEDPRIACVVIDEGDGSVQFDRWAAALTAVAPCRPAPVLVPMGGRLTIGELDQVDGLLVCGGLTPAYAEAVTPVAAELVQWLAGRPYCGFSAGAAVAAPTAVTGGWLVGGRQVAPEDAAEDLDEVTMTPGLGLVPFSVDVHCAQWGTLPRLLAACWSTGIDGLALDENTRCTWRRGAVEVAGLGHAYLLQRAGDSVQVRRFADGDRFVLADGAGRATGDAE